jgi:hypothetical protein
VTNKNFKKIFHRYKVVQKQIGDAHVHLQSGSSPSHHQQLYPFFPCAGYEHNGG